MRNRYGFIRKLANTMWIPSAKADRIHDVIINESDKIALWGKFTICQS